MPPYAKVAQKCMFLPNWWGNNWMAYTKPLNLNKWNATFGMSQALSLKIWTQPALVAEWKQIPAVKFQNGKRSLSQKSWVCGAY